MDAHFYVAEGAVGLPPTRIICMTTLYTQNLNGSGAILNQRIKKYARAEDLLACREELFLQQSVLEDRVEGYAEALEEGSREKKTAWGGVVLQTADTIINSKERIARIQHMTSSTITRETLFMIVRNIADLLYETFEDTEKVAEVVAAIEAGALGTSSGDVSESELFSELINSVPLLTAENAPV